MSNILDYINWRGDLPLSVSSFNNIDALILCQISYLNFDGILDNSFKPQMTVAELAARFKNAPDFKTRSDTGALINQLSVRLLYDAGASERFGGMSVCGYVNIIDLAKEEQFSAMTFHTGDGKVFVAFRGTDDTIVGWKEDFNMGVETVVPAQQDAVAYLDDAVHAMHGKIRVGGHSKGGNLAIYAAAMSGRKVFKRIIEIYNNDGPGFSSETIDSAPFREVLHKLHSFYPQFSIVGMLFSHAGAYTVIESDQSGLMQHDPFSWHLQGTRFVSLPGFDESSVFFHQTFNTWFTELKKEQRSQFVETLFNIIQATDARTNSELEKNWLHNSAKIIKALAKQDKETKQATLNTVKILFKIAQRNLPELKIKENQKASKLRLQSR